MPVLRPRLALLLVTLFVPLAAATTALGACGDGVLQVGETCDPSAPNGDTACEEACVPAGFSGQCTCAAPSHDSRRYAIIAGSQLRVGKHAVVGFGDVAVSQGGSLAIIGREASLAGASQLVADQARVQRGASLGRLFANAAILQAGVTLANGGPFAIRLPLLLVPEPDDPPPVQPGVDAVSVAPGETHVLAPGRYDAVTVGPGATLVLHGLSAGGAGVYDLRSLLVMANARVLAHNPVIVRAEERLGFASSGASGGSFIGPSSNMPLVAGDVQIAAGKSVKVGGTAVVTAHVSAPTVRIGPAALFTGQIRGQKVALNHNAFVFLQGGCGDGILDPGEECDTSATGGDAACPGACVRGDPNGLGDLTAGLPGQCTCRCASNAACDDGNACNGTETCQNQICVAGIPPSCNDHNPCTRDCDAARGCVNAPVTDGTSCNDGNPCTGGDSCQSGACTAGAPVTEGTACSDGDRCTLFDACHAGACVAGPARDCSDDNTCSIDTCDPAAGCIHTLIGNGEPCSDSDVCTLFDACQDGACIGTEARNCDDGNPCTADACDAIAGCQHPKLPDGTVCGTDRTCQAGACS